MHRKQTLLTDREFAVLASHGLTDVEIVRPSETRVWFEGRRVGMKIVRRKRNTIRLYAIDSDGKHFNCTHPEVMYNREGISDLASHLAISNTIEIFFDKHDNDPDMREKPIIFYVDDNSISVGVIDDLDDISSYNGLMIKIDGGSRQPIV